MTTQSMPSPSSPAVSNFWLSPLGYAHSAVFLGGLWAMGFALQILKGGIQPPVWPVNIIVLGLLVCSCIACFVTFKNRPLVAWLGGIPFALTSLGALILLAVVAGVVPQDAQYQLPTPFAQLGFNQILTSWPFVFTLMAMLFNIGLASLKHMTWPVTFAKVLFALNHVGLFLVIACALFGAGDVTRVRFMLPEGQFDAVAFDDKGHAHPMPFGVYLKQFSLEEYPPTLMLAGAMTGESLWSKGDPIVEVAPNTSAALTHKTFAVTVQVQQYFPHGRVIQQAGGIGYIASERASDPPVCFVLAQNTKTGAKASGWVTRGGPMSLPQVVTVPNPNGDLNIEMSQARPKRFLSDVVIAKPDKTTRPAKLEVNHPQWIEGWALYQHSYEQAIGSGVSVSIIEAVQDNWLPGVYVGILMLLIASGIFLLNAGRKPMNPEGQPRHE